MGKAKLNLNIFVINFLYIVIFLLPIAISQIGQQNGVIIFINFILDSIAAFVFIVLILQFRFLAIALLPVIFFVQAALTFAQVMYQIPDLHALVWALFYTNISEAREFLSWQLLIWLLIALLAGFVSSYCAMSIKRRSINLLSLFILACFLLLSFPNNKVLQIVYLVYEYKSEQHRQSVLLSNKQPFVEEINVSASFPQTIVFVIGESARFDHFGINGYARNTTPNLATIKGLISLDNKYSCANNTYQSVPFILTGLDCGDKDKPFKSPTIIEKLKKYGYETVYISNKPPIPNIVLAEKFLDKIIVNEKSRYGYRSQVITDYELLPMITELLDASKKQLIVIDSIGSHWQYYFRSEAPDKLYQPECTKPYQKLCSKEEIINAYDNSIIATDRFLFALIKQLAEESAMLVYTSDHGEFLGEKGLWGHVIDDLGREQYHVPFLLWQSDEFKEKQKAVDSFVYEGLGFL